MSRPETILSRDHFEEKVFLFYFIQSIERVGDGPFPFTTTNITKDEFVVQKDGRYVRDDVQMMWLGYQIAQGVVP